MKLVKRYSNVSNLVLFRGTVRTSLFCLKSFGLFSTEGLRGRGQLRVQKRHCPANKIASLLHKHNGKGQDLGNNAT